MSFDLERLRRLAARGPVARTVVAATRGSVPREVGAAMLVTDTDAEGTIGGGALEFQAIAAARAALSTGSDRVDTMPLGPGLGQCCGGAVTVLIEIWEEARLSGLSGNVVARPLPGEPAVMPLSVRRLLGAARNAHSPLVPGVVGGWMVEPVSGPSRHVWIWGAGHVGRALVKVLSPLPEIELVWIDTGKDRFPEDVPEGVRTLVAANPADLVSLAPDSAEHLVLTYSHALDLELCHRVLSRGFRALGLIGSATKRARFRSRLAALGHSAGQIDRLVCPIGDRSLGKHPHAIALGVASDLLRKSDGGTIMTRAEV